MKKKILVTGANGFIGRSLCNSIRDSGDIVRILVRTKMAKVSDEQFIFRDKENIDISAFLGVDVVIHLAGYAHDTANKRNNDDKYWDINVELTEKILNLSLQSKVSKFIFISSVKAGGIPDNSRKCFSESFCAKPNNIYGETKIYAEKRILDIAKKSDINISIIRPSLVYGPKMKGNLHSMLYWIDKGWFPPLPENGNVRSMVHIDDLVDAIRLVCNYNKSNGEVFIVTDGRRYSSYEIYNTMCDVLKKSIPKYRIPPFVFVFIGWFNKNAQYKIGKLLGSECYSSKKIESIGFKAKKSLLDMNITEY